MGSKLYRMSLSIQTKGLDKGSKKFHCSPGGLGGGGVIIRRFRFSRTIQK